MTPQEIIDKYYPAGTARRDIYLDHANSVANLALKINADRQLGLDPETVRNAAMLHDIGIFMTDAPGIDCHGSEKYISHGALGADLLRQNGFPEEYARVAEAHTGVGLTPEIIEVLNFPLPPGRDYMPRTMLEKLICYADKFYSKSGSRAQKTFRQARASIARHGGDSLARFDALAALFTPNPA